MRMNSHRLSFNRYPGPGQRGVVLFFALIALVVITLAAIALVRSVDTANLISGNLAFKQGATSSGDTGVEAAMVFLNTNQATLNNNATAGNNGYYNSLNPAINLTTLAWTNANSAAAAVDQAGNSVRYIVQRMCKHPTAQAANLSSGATINVSDVNCVLTDAIDTSTKKFVEDPLPGGSGSPIYRITAQVSGPRNTVSYVQGYVY